MEPSDRRHFGRYELVRTIASGGMAQVYEARALTRDGGEERVALKRILPEHAGRDDMKKLFFDEARVAQRLHHPNVVEVLDFGSFEDTEFLVFELVDGLDAGEAFREGRANERRLRDAALLRVFADVAAALAHAHAHGVVHRDVSPSNVLLSWNGDVKLADFGIALFAERERTKTATGLVRGKEAFMAPEQARGERVGPAADIWALGATLAALDTGGVSLEPETLSPTIRDFVARCTRATPDERPSASELAAEAAAFAQAFEREALARALAPLREASRGPSAFDRALDLCLVAPDLDAGTREFTMEHRASAALAETPPHTSPPEREPPEREPSTQEASRPPIPMEGAEVVLPTRGVPSGLFLALLIGLGAVGALSLNRTVEDRTVEPPARPPESPAEVRGVEEPHTRASAPGEPRMEASEVPAAGALTAETAMTPTMRTRTTMGAMMRPRATQEPATAAAAAHAPAEPPPTASPLADGTPSTGWLRVAGASLLGARVFIDGQSVGHAPLLRQVGIGAHTIEARDPTSGEVRARATVQVHPEHRRGAPATLVR